MNTAEYGRIRRLEQAGGHDMWVVQRSDSAHTSAWATGRDAKHYIACLGAAVPVAPRTFDIRLPSGKRITASMVRW